MYASRYRSRHFRLPLITSMNSPRTICASVAQNIQSLFYEALYNHRAYSACIQSYENVCDRPGEYAKEAMLICPLFGPINNMPLPVLAHQRNRYSVVAHNRIRQLRQHRVSYEPGRLATKSTNVATPVLPSLVTTEQINPHQMTWYDAFSGTARGGARSNTQGINNLPDTTSSTRPAFPLSADFHSTTTNRSFPALMDGHQMSF